MADLVSENVGLESEIHPDLENETLVQWWSNGWGFGAVEICKASQCGALQESRWRQINAWCSQLAAGGRVFIFRLADGAIPGLGLRNTAEIRSARAWIASRCGNNG